ncbi:hypothetical protein ACH35V_21815 [Actinomadura sp. 1N219]
MGKHGKKEKCGMCNGTGKIKTGTNGKGRQQEVQCTGCNGSGEQG